MDEKSMKEVAGELKNQIKDEKTWKMTEQEIVMSYIFVEAHELERQGEIENASEVFEIVEERKDESSESGDTAVEILKKRFAKGEISEEEFKNKKELIE